MQKRNLLLISAAGGFATSAAAVFAQGIFPGLPFAGTLTDTASQMATIAGLIIGLPSAVGAMKFGENKEDKGEGTKLLSEKGMEYLIGGLIVMSLVIAILTGGSAAMLVFNGLFSGLMMGLFLGLALSFFSGIGTSIAGRISGYVAGKKKEDSIKDTIKKLEEDGFDVSVSSIRRPTEYTLNITPGQLAHAAAQAAATAQQQAPSTTAPAGGTPASGPAPSHGGTP